jgi:PPOX class probable FMN-dependent enzyme
MVPFQRVVTTEAELRAIIGTPIARSLLKEQAKIDHHFRAFIARSPFVLIATAGADGTCDVSPKGDVPGFVRVLDDTRLVIPDRNGNKRLDGMKNLLSNPQVGLLFLVPGRDETLRINGRAWVTADPAVLEPSAVNGVAPRLAIGVEVRQAFLHCVKAFRRSRLWARDTWPEPGALESIACVIFDQIKPDGMTLEEFEHGVLAGDAKLYV